MTGGGGDASAEGIPPPPVVLRSGASVVGAGHWVVGGASKTDPCGGLGFGEDPLVVARKGAGLTSGRGFGAKGGASGVGALVQSEFLGWRGLHGRRWGGETSD